MPIEATKYATPEKLPKTSKPSGGAYGSASSDRPYACPYEGCSGKAYIHEYKLKLHLRREHPAHMADENAENPTPNAENEMDEGSDQEAYVGKRVSGKSQKSRPKPNVKMPAAKIMKRKGLSPAPANIVKKSWPVKEEAFEEEDSEETEEERENGWRYGENNDEDDEETEDED